MIPKCIKQKQLEDKVDKLSTYSTKEKVIGKWIDGKTLYRKTISCGALPNQSTVTINHNINNLDKVINVRGYATNSNKTSFLPLPYPNANSICLFCESNIIGIITYSDRTSYTECYITLEYTKTTD